MAIGKKANIRSSNRSSKKFMVNRNNTITDLLKQRRKELHMLINRSLVTFVRKWCIVRITPLAHLWCPASKQFSFLSGSIVVSRKNSWTNQYLNNLKIQTFQPPLIRLICILHKVIIASIKE